MSDGYRIGRLVFIVLAALLLLAPPSAAASGRCSLAGTWIGDNDAGLAFLITFIPLDPAHDRLASIAGGANDATGFGLFPTAVDYTPFQGEVKRTGRRTFDYTGLAYARDELGWIGTYAVSGSWTLSEDCGTGTVVWHASTFFAGQDPFADTPFFCFPPITGSYHRVSVVPSLCEE